VVTFFQEKLVSGLEHFLTSIFAFRHYLFTHAHVSSTHKTNVRFYFSMSDRFVKGKRPDLFCAGIYVKTIVSVFILPDFWVWSCSKICILSGVLMPLGGLVTLVVLLPNLLMIFFPPTNLPPAAEMKISLTAAMEIVERAGQVSAFVVPFYYPLRVWGTLEIASLAGMILALFFYYLIWGRYVLQGRTFWLLYQPCVGVPIPLAISPVIYFLAASALFHSWVLLAAAIVLGIGHIYVSNLEWQRVRPPLETV
jgi:hypothetical protein